MYLFAYTRLRLETAKLQYKTTNVLNTLERATFYPRLRDQPRTKCVNDYIRADYKISFAYCCCWLLNNILHGLHQQQNKPKTLQQLQLQLQQQQYVAIKKCTNEETKILKTRGKPQARNFVACGFV